MRTVAEQDELSLPKSDNYATSRQSRLGRSTEEDQGVSKSVPTMAVCTSNDGSWTIFQIRVSQDSSSSTDEIFPINAAEEKQRRSVDGPKTRHTRE